MKYYYLLMSQQDMIQNQVLVELLRERVNYYLSKGKNIDFWLTVSPDFIFEMELNKKIEKTNFYKQNESVIKYKKEQDQCFYSALISLDKNYINWIQLRLGYFEDIKNPNSPNLSVNSVSDGIFGWFDTEENISGLSYNKNLIHPLISTKKYEILSLS